MSTKTRIRYGRDVGIVRLGIENNHNIYARVLMDEIDSFQEQMGNVSREMQILRIRKKC